MRHATAKKSSDPCYANFQSTTLRFATIESTGHGNQAWCTNLFQNLLLKRELRRLIKGVSVSDLHSISSVSQSNTQRIHVL